MVVSLPGCGGGTSSTSGSGGFTTGIDKAYELSGLTPKEVDQICAAGDRFLQKEFTTENLCQLLTVVQAAEQKPVQSEQACEAVVRECISSLGQYESESAPCNRAALSAVSCKATVSVFERCVDEMASEFEGFVSRAQCSKPDASIKDDYLAVFGAVDSNTIPQTPSCVELAGECPGLF